MKKQTMMIGILMICLISISAGCSFFDNTQVFRNEIAKSEVKVPKDWKIEENSGQKIAKSPDENVLVLMMIAPVPPEAQGDLKGEYTLDNYSDIERANFLTNFKAGFIRTTQGVTTADSGFLKTDSGHTACYLIAHSTLPDQPSVYALVLIKNDQMVTVLAMGKNIVAFDAHKEELAKILKTWKVD